MNSKFAAGFIDGTSVLVGTLADFRKLEHGLNKADPYEGAVGFAGPGSVTVGDNGAAGLHNVKIHVGNIPAPVIKYQLPNHFVFCASKNADDIVASDLDANYDCCIEILNPGAFLTALESAILAQFPHNDGGTVGDVEYCERFFNISDISSADLYLSAFRKAKGFSQQAEYRLAVPCDQLRKPTIFKINMGSVKTRIHHI